MLHRAYQPSSERLSNHEKQMCARRQGVTHLHARSSQAGDTAHRSKESTRFTGPLAKVRRRCNLPSKFAHLTGPEPLAALCLSVGSNPPNRRLGQIHCP